MASIQKRQTAKGTSYNVVYYYMDENGQKKQKWESFSTYKEASKRKAAVENQQNKGTFLPPTDQTVAEFLMDFVEIYGTKKWGVSMYGSCTALISNYVDPILGEMKLRDITTRTVDKYIQTLQRTPPVTTRTRQAKTQYVTDKTIEKIIKLLRYAFRQAVRWELISKNPFDYAILPKTEYAKRDIWDAETICKALDKCTDRLLYIAMNLAFACSLRMGEILGLTWNNVHISDSEIATDNAYIYVDKELIRVSKQALEKIGEKDIFHIFPPTRVNTTTRLVLKTPKTATSARKVWLPNVVFHSLRHSSTTYKLKLNHGDLKATQGDTGHAQASMVTQIYAHVLDKDHKVNAQKFGKAFYARPDLRASRPPEEKRDGDVPALIRGYAAYPA